MKKLVSLILVLAMVLACSMALAEAPTKRGSANDFEELPDFFEPIGMKTKRGGDGYVTVTLDGEVDSLEVCWYGVGEEYEELEVVDGVAKYNAEGHKYQPGVSGRALNIVRGTEKQPGFPLTYTWTLGQQVNWGTVELVDGTIWNVVAVNNTTDNVALSNQNSFTLPTAYDADCVWLRLEQYDDLGNVIASQDVTSSTMAYDIFDVWMTSDDQFAYMDEYDQRVTGDPNGPLTGYGRDGGERVWYWTVEKCYDIAQDGTRHVMWKVIQPWGIKVDGPAYKATVGDVSIYYDRFGKFMYEEIEVADADPFAVGESGTAVYTYSKMVAKSNEAYYLSKVSCTFEEGEYTSIWQKFLPNAAKTGLYLHIDE